MQDLRQLHKQDFSIYPLCSPVDVLSPWAHEDGWDIQLSDLFKVYLVAAAPERSLGGVAGKVHIPAGAAVAEVGDSCKVVDFLHHASGCLRRFLDLSELPASGALFSGHLIAVVCRVERRGEADDHHRLCESGPVQDLCHHVDGGLGIICLSAADPRFCADLQFRHKAFKTIRILFAALSGEFREREHCKFLPRFVLFCIFFTVAVRIFFRCRVCSICTSISFRLKFCGFYTLLPVPSRPGPWVPDRSEGRRKAFPAPEDPQEIQLRRACRRNKTPHPEPTKTVHFHPSCMSRQNDRPSGFPISAHQPVNQRTLSRVPRDLHRTEVFRVCPKIRLLRKDLPNCLRRLPLFIRIRNPRNRYESL